MVEEVERWGYRRSVRGGAKDRGCFKKDLISKILL